MAVSETAIAQGFKLIEDAALVDERAPQNEPFGPMRPPVLKELFHRGMVRSQVYRNNWRRFTLLVGPNAGKTTRAYPDPNAKPYKTVNGDGRPRPEYGVPKGGEPSKPRLLTLDEIERL